MSKEFKTTAFYLAAYLLAQGISMTRFDRDYGGRTEFTFEDSQRRSDLTEEFMVGKRATVNVHYFIGAIKQLKGVIYDS